MNKKIKAIILTLMVSVSLGLGVNFAVQASKAPKKQVQKTIQTTPVKTDGTYEAANSLDIVANPAKYLNKKVKIKAKFDKFTTLGLDYKPAFRSSEKYITFLIKRDDVKDHTMPLSEMKNFLERKEAEKFVDLKSGDDIEYSGVVFSNALGDTWISVDKFVVINSQSLNKNPVKK